MTTADHVAARADEAVKIYGEGDAEVRALDGVTIGFRHGEFSAIMGPSGSGKSTLLHTMAGLDQLTSGRVYIGGVDLTTLKEKHGLEMSSQSDLEETGAPLHALLVLSPDAI